MSKIVKQEVEQHVSEATGMSYPVLSVQAKAGDKVRCIKAQGFDAEQVTKGKEYEVVSGPEDEAVGFNSAIILDDRGELHEVSLYEEDELVSSGAISQFALVS